MKKKIILVLFVLVFLSLIAGCSYVQKTLMTPENLRIEGNMLKWNSVEGATNYIIFVNGNEEDNSTTAQYDLTRLDLIIGQSYSIGVVANGDGLLYLRSQLSNTVNYVASYNDTVDDTGNDGIFDPDKVINNTPGNVTTEDVSSESIGNNLFELGLGYGVNALTATSAISGVRLSAVFNDNTLTIDNIGAYNIGSSTTTAISKESIEEEIAALNSKMVFGNSTNASLAGMFTTGYSTKFSLDTAVSSKKHVNQYYFVMNHYIVGKNYQLKDYTTSRKYSDKLTEDLLLDLQDLRAGILTENAFIQRYGTHLRMAVSYGGMAEIYYSRYSKEEINSASITSGLQASLNAGLSISNMSSGFSTELVNELESNYESSSNNTMTSLYATSVGSNAIASITFDGFAAGYPDWVRSMDNPDSYRIVDVADAGLVPIWYYFPNEYSDVAQKLSDYFNSEAIKCGLALKNKMIAPVDNGDTVNFDGGNGEQGKPYIVSTKQHFINMINQDNDGKYYKLNKDIDLGDWSTYGISNWATDKITATKPFKGILDGNSKTIKYKIRIGKTSLMTWAVGLFPAIENATIKNLNVEADLSTYDPQNRNQKWDISNDDRAEDALIGGIAGYAYDESKIENCTISGTVRYNSDGGGRDTVVGGVIGYSYDSTISNCSSSTATYARGCWVSVSGVIGCIKGGSYGNLTFTGTINSNEDWFGGGTYRETNTVGRKNHKVLETN